jgi:hypothetical protein
VAAVEVRVGSAARVATLEWLSGQLKRDVEVLGTLVPTKDSVKANPSVAGLCRVIADLERFAAVEQEESDDTATLHAI